MKAKVVGGGGSRSSKADSGGNSSQAFGPMPNFEREIQRILAEQVLESDKVKNLHITVHDSW